jgi:hypothetical protein
MRGSSGDGYVKLEWKAVAVTDTEPENPDETQHDETPDEPAELDHAASDDDERELEADDDERDGLSGDAQPAQPQGLTPEGLEKRARAAEKRFETYARSIATLYDDEAQYLVPCALCPDQHKGLLDARSAGYVPQEIQDAVRMYFGIARQRDYPQSASHRTCSNCQGEGKVATGSHVPEHETITCPSCQGRGYEGPQVSPPIVNGGLTGPTAYDHDSPVTQAFEDRDEWDEPRILPDGRDNPNFGRMPNRKVLVEPWGQTAGLNSMSSIAP